MTQLIGKVAIYKKKDKKLVLFSFVAVIFASKSKEGRHAFFSH